MSTDGQRTSSRTGQLSEIFPTFQGEGVFAGRRQLFVRLGGCDVGCRFCDTPDALRRSAGFEVRGPTGEAESRHDNPVAAERVADLVTGSAERHGPFHAVAITGGEPLEQAEFLADLLPRIEPPVLLETAGTMPDELGAVLPAVDIVSMDLKLPSVAGIPPCFDLHRRFLRIALERDVYVKVVVSDRLESSDWSAAIRLVAEVAPGLPFVIQPQTGRDGRLRATFPLLFDLAARATSAGLTDVRVLPQTHRILEAP